MSNEESILVNELKKIIVCSKCHKERKIIKFYTDLAKIKLICKNKKCKEKDEEETLDLDELIEDKFLEKPSEYENKDEEDQKILDENANNRDLVSDESKPHKKTLKDKIIMLSNIIRANQLVLETQEKHPNNYYHILSLENLGKSYEKEAQRKENFVDDLDKNLEDIEKKINDQNKILEDIKSKCKKVIKKEHIEQPNLRLVLRGKSRKEGINIIKLEDQGFELITQLIFKNLKEFIVASNKIKNIECLNNMLLPHLELLDMGDNEIEDIQAIANIKSRYLTTIILNDNKIKTLNPFYEEKPIYFKLQILAVQNNQDLIGKEKEFKGIKEKHKGIKILFESININEFNKRHNTNIIEDEKSYNLGRIKKNREILLDDLFSLIKFENKIRYLILDNNNIKDASLLSKMPLFSLRRLDLSVNKINNISFLKKLSKTCKKLADLFLDTNEIYDISVLKCDEPEEEKVKNDLEISASTSSEQKNKNKNEEIYKQICIFHYLKNLCIKNNKFDANKDSEIKEIIECFNNKKINTDIEFDEKDDKKKLNDESNKNEPNENNNNN